MDTPVNEEEYTPSDNLYPINKSLREQDDGVTADKLRTEQVDSLANLLLQQIDRIQRWEVNEDPESDLARRHVIEGAFADIDILFEELDSGLLLSESERTERKQSNTAPLAQFAHQGSKDIKATPLQLRIEKWQREKRQRTNKLKRMERSIHQLGLSVHDSRCKQVLLDKKSLIDSLEKSISTGVAILHDVSRQLQLLYAGRPAAPQ